jgi:hypothetical protein
MYANACKFEILSALFGVQYGDSLDARDIVSNATLAQRAANFPLMRNLLKVYKIIQIHPRLRCDAVAESGGGSAFDRGAGLTG